MSVTVSVQAASTLLTTLDRVRAELGYADSETTDDDVLQDLIERASSAIAYETRRTFGLETVLETLDGSGSRLLPLTRTPILEVTEVTEDSTVLDTTEYSVEDKEAGALYRRNGWGRSGGLRMWGNEAFSSGYILPGYQDQRYTVTYRAGYLLPGEINPYLGSGSDDPQPLPGAVEQACLDTVRAWFLDRDADPSVGAVRVGTLSVTYRGDSTSSTPPGSLPPSALGRLRNYYARVLS
jgi:hypothetical protein